MATYGWITDTEADTYFATRLGAEEIWVSGAEKESALTTAYKQLFSCGLYSFPDTATQAMKDAQCEQALFLLIQEPDERLGLQAQGVQQAWLVKEEYKKGDLGKIPISPYADALLTDLKSDSVGARLYVVELERDEEETGTHL